MKHEIYFKIKEHLRTLIKGTEWEGHVFTVGGCVRDELMGSEIKDIDLCVNLPSGGIRFAEWLRDNGYTMKGVTIYPNYGTAMLHLKAFPDVELEFVQTRKEKYIDHSCRNPATAFGIIEDDCMRRDLTINALYSNVSTDEIRPKIIGIWLKDQLNRPDWFHNMVVDRSVWGAFSIYAHAKRSDGKPKISYKSKAKAEKAAFDMTKRYGYPFTTYKCLFCDGWHVSRAAKKDATEKTTEEIALDKYAVKVSVRPDILDVERIMSTGIPDLAPVYGGFRGRTLSSNRQLHAWNTMIESGISLIIDLRADYSSDFYSELCQRSGISYFKFPVAYEKEWIAKMIDLFPEFCRLIDNGRFYIACAMGLHRTDIALCTYWVFYAADKGIAPPPICGYRKDKGLNTNKIMRMLNAVYKYMTEKNGIEPFPEIVFLERKEIIKKLSGAQLENT